MSKQIDFKLLYETHAKPLIYFCTRFLPIEKAEDVVQDLFLKLLDRDDIDLKSATVKSFLYTSAKNACLDWLKKEHKISYQSSYDVYEFTLQELSVSKEYFEKEDVENRLKIVNEHINQLPPASKRYLQDYFMLNMSYKEMALKYNLSERTIQNVVFRSIKSLRLKLANVK